MIVEGRAYTDEEARDQFLYHLRELVRYWHNLPEEMIQLLPGETPTLARMNGLVFSILNIFDGTAMALPAIDLVLRPHPDDKEFHQAEGDNWWKPDMVINGPDLLHDLWYKRSTQNAK